MIEGRLGWATTDAFQREGLLLGRPGAGSSGDKAAWMLYESGDVVLRRSRHERDVVEAAAFHLLALRAAVDSPLLPLRLRPVILPDGDALLVDPRALYDVAGHDRWFASRGCDVLPTTIALVDPASGELLLPEQDVDHRIPRGRRRIDQILLREPEEAPLEDAAAILAMSATVLRDPQRDLRVTLDQIDRMAPPNGGLIELLPRAAITNAVRQRAGGHAG